MPKASELLKNYYRPKDIANFLGVTTRTLQNWEKDNKISFRRDPISNRRYMTRDDTVRLLVKHHLFLDDSNNHRHDIIYARVSSHHQKNNGDLDRQIRFLLDNNNDLQNVLILSEVGSGLNDKRKKLQQLLRMVMNDEVNRVFVTYRDRLTRFGFNYLETVLNKKNVKIIVVQQKCEEKSIEQELVDDMMSLIASFSGKLYGLRSKKNKIDLEKLSKQNVSFDEVGLCSNANL